MRNTHHLGSGRSAGAAVAIESGVTYISERATLEADRSLRGGGEILIVEDEQPIREMLAFSLQRAGYAVRQAEDADTALAYLADERPDLLLIDWMLPGVSGLELTRRIKSESAHAPAVIMVSARAAEADRLAGLQSGADDYVTKPFSVRELLARIHAVLRKFAPAADRGESIERYGVTLDQAAELVTVGARRVSLSPAEYRMLAFLMTHVELVCTRDQLLGQFHHEAEEFAMRAVDVHIARIRNVLEQFGLDHLVKTVRGVGYRFSGREH